MIIQYYIALSTYLIFSSSYKTFVDNSYSYFKDAFTLHLTVCWFAALVWPFFLFSDMVNQDI